MGVNANFLVARDSIAHPYVTNPTMGRHLVML
jgi:hypothetical protein